MLTSSKFPAHFIVDQGRSGVQNIRQQWGDWCNVKGAGFGTRPTTSTTSSLIDAIVWVKPGGECDGTSNTSSPRYDAHCGQSDADQPAPEAGTWFQVRILCLVAHLKRITKLVFNRNTSRPWSRMLTQPSSHIYTLREFHLCMIYVLQNKRSFVNAIDYPRPCTIHSFAQ